MLVVRNEKLPQRCEVCHQADLFDAASGQCRRCDGLIGGINNDGAVVTVESRSLDASAGAQLRRTSWRARASVILEWVFRKNRMNRLELDGANDNPLAYPFVEPELAARFLFRCETYLFLLGAVACVFTAIVALLVFDMADVGTALIALSGCAVWDVVFRGLLGGCPACRGKVLVILDPDGGNKEPPAYCENCRRRFQ